MSTTQQVVFWNVLGAIVVIVVVFYLFQRQSLRLNEMFRGRFEHMESQIDDSVSEMKEQAERDAESLRVQIVHDMQLVNEKLDGHLRLLVTTDGKAKESIAALNGAIARIESLEVRLNAADHRLAFIERSQEVVLDAARRIDTGERG